VADEWYLTDVPRLVSETGLLYRRIVEKAPEKTCEAVTVQRTVEERNWGETVGQLSPARQSAAWGTSTSLR